MTAHDQGTYWMTPTGKENPMSPEPREPREPRESREREVIVTNGDSRSYGGLIVAVLAIIVFGVLGYLFIGALGGEGGDGTAELDVPDEVNVDVEDGTDGGTDG